MMRHKMSNIEYNDIQYAVEMTINIQIETTV